MGFRSYCRLMGLTLSKFSASVKYIRIKSRKDVAVLFFKITLAGSGTGTRNFASEFGKSGKFVRIRIHY